MDLRMIFSESLTIVNSETYLGNSHDGLVECAKGLQKITVGGV